MANPKALPAIVWAGVLRGILDVAAAFVVYRRFGMRPIPLLQGIAVYFFMQRVILPLSLATRYPFSWEMMSIGVAIHIFCVGLPIAGMVRWKSS